MLSVLPERRQRCRGGGGVPEPVDDRPTSTRGRDTSWWTEAHNSASKAPSTYAAESRSGVSQGNQESGGWENQTELLCGPGRGLCSEDRGGEKHKEKRNRGWNS